MKSENTQQVNGKRKSKQDYNAWSVEESRMLLQLMVDAASRGWLDANGMLSKATVEIKILPKINEKLRCHKVFLNFQCFSYSKFFLMDCGFPNRRQFLAPFRGVRYHLQEFRGQGRAPANEVELFNLRHLSLRNFIERIFGLHNFLRKECRFDEFPVELENESSSSSSLPVNEGDLELVFQTQEQQRQNANEWRVGIALDMWRDVGHNDNNENQG
ncbi:unnamed protein product [Prunus brigantina]